MALPPNEFYKGPSLNVTPSYTGYMPHPGFDTSGYPGDHALTVWKQHSPFEWVGYYLGGPCHHDLGWRGRRAFIESLGFNLLPVYVGLQGGQGCGHASLSFPNGAKHGQNAADAMKNDGFPSGRYVYLDVEPIDGHLSPAHRSYVKGWVDAVLHDGSYLPGLYLHRKNADELRAILNASLQGHGHHEPARLWVCGGPASFDIADAPSKSTVADAHAWQGELDKDHAFGGVTLHIDRSVSLTPTPGA